MKFTICKKEIKEKMFQIEPKNCACANTKKHNFSATLMTRPDGLFSYCDECANEMVQKRFELVIKRYEHNQILEKINNLKDDNFKNPFHIHLDECQQCREQPFNLCPEGTITMNFAMHIIELQLKGKYEKEKIDI